MIAAAAGHMLVDASAVFNGGTVVRNAVALSALMSKPISLANVRKGRNNSGLTHQNIAGDSQVLSSALTKTCTNQTE